MLFSMNSELEENYNKRKMLLPLSLFFLLVVPMAVVILFPPSNLSIVIILSTVIVGFIVLNYVPYLSEYDYIRHHLKKLIEFSESGHVKKSKKHINKLAYHIFEFNRKLDDIFLLNPAKQTLDKFLKLLRYQIYPHLTESDLKSYSDILKDIDIAMDAKNTKLLNETLVKFIGEEEIQQSASLFTYEKQPLSERFTKGIIHLIRNNKIVNYSVKFSIVLFVLVTIVYFFSPTISFLNLDSPTFGILLLVTHGFANKI